MKITNNEISLSINSFDDLINIINKYDIATDDLIQIIQSTLNIFISDDECQDKEHLIKQLKEFWVKYSNHETLPLFLDNPLEDDIMNL